jgi:hypothetical protein
MRPEQRLYPRRMCVGRRVRVLPIDLGFCRGVRVRAQEQCPPHDPTNQVELVPGIPEHLTETRERYWNLQLLYVGHHNYQILVRDRTQVTEALDDRPACRMRNGLPPGTLKTSSASLPTRVASRQSSSVSTKGECQTGMAASREGKISK